MLVQSTLVNGLSKIFDPESPLFEGWPETNADAARRWAEAFNNYASNVVPFSSTSQAAKTAFENTFLGITNENGLVQFPLCFVNYAVALAPGMSASTFVGTPPIGTPVFEALFASGLSGASSATCIIGLVNIIDLWMRTGLAVHSVSGATVNWS